MGIIAIALALSCAEPKLINASKEPWTKFDRKTIQTAKVRCGQIYKESPCVKVFKKTRPRTYVVVCTQPGRKYDGFYAESCVVDDGIAYCVDSRN